MTSSVPSLDRNTALHENSNWTRLKCFPNCFNPFEAFVTTPGDPPVIMPDIIPSHQADPLIVLDFDVRDMFNGDLDHDWWPQEYQDTWQYWHENYNYYLGGMGPVSPPTAICEAIFQMFTSHTSVEGSLFSNNNGMLMWFRGKCLVRRPWIRPGRPYRSAAPPRWPTKEGFGNDSLSSPLLVPRPLPRFV